MGLITQFWRGNCEIYIGSTYKNAQDSGEENNLEIRDVVLASEVYLALWSRSSAICWFVLMQKRESKFVSSMNVSYNAMTFPVLSFKEWLDEILKIYILWSVRSCMHCRWEKLWKVLRIPLEPVDLSLKRKNKYMWTKPGWIGRSNLKNRTFLLSLSAVVG